jgi:hypothetical protein
MIQYNPQVNDMRGDYMMQAAQTNAQMMSDLGQNIGGALASLGGMYAQNKGLEAEAAGYDRIGEILGGSMFKDNPAVGGFLADLRKQKNPQMKIAGYNALFNMAGPISNSLMAQRTATVRASAPIVGQQITNANTQAEEGPSLDGTMLP